MMFKWFESLLNPFPAAEPKEPPKTLVAFCLYYTRGAWPAIVAMAVGDVSFVVEELQSFVFPGDVV